MNYSEEEKEALEQLKSLSPSEEAIDTILNLIQKQEKIIDNYKEMIINHKKQLKQSGIYGYDYDLNIIEKEVENGDRKKK